MGGSDSGANVVQLAAGLPRSRFRSAELPVGERFDAWRESVAPVFRPWLAADPGEWSASTDAVLLGEAILASTALVGVGGCRKPGSSARHDPAELVTVLHFLRGGFRGSNGDCPLEVGSGDTVIVDSTRELNFVSSRESRGITLVMPRQTLLAALGGDGTPRPGVVAGRSLAGQVLGNVLRTTWRGLSGAGCDEADGLDGMLASAVAGVMRRRPAAMPAPGDELLAKATLDAVCAYIESRLADPDLGPASLCRHFSCSRARLYRICAPLEGGVAGYIRRARLARCHAALLSARGRGGIADIALHWGFGNVSHFNRLFRATYGVSPREVRALGRRAERDGPSVAGSPQLAVPEYRHWLAQF
jgi:AraC-like DNA-binding protein